MTTGVATRDRPVRAAYPTNRRFLPWLTNAELLLGGVALTILDAAATTLWLRLGMAVEGNPLLVELIGATGVGHAMVLRAVLGCMLLVALFTIAPRSRLARPALCLALVALTGVGAIHLQGAILLASA